MADTKDFRWLHWPGLDENGKEYSNEEIVSHASMFRHTGPGVYFLLNMDEIVYVGKSVDVARRLEEHWKMEENPKTAKDWNRYFVIRCEPEDLSRLEAYYILRFRPRYNIAVPKKGNEL